MVTVRDPRAIAALGQPHRWKFGKRWFAQSGFEETIAALKLVPLQMHAFHFHILDLDKYGFSITCTLFFCGTKNLATTAVIH
jgi:hypothetical protein